MIVPPQPFEEALDALEKRIPRGEPWDTKRWMKERPAVRQRAFFSAQIENTQFLQRAKDFLTDYLTNATEPVFNDDGSPRIDPQTGQQMTVLKAQGRADFVRQMREFMAAEGMMPAGKIDDEDIKKIYSRRRLELIFDTNVRTSYGFGYWEQGNEPEILEAYPAARFVRIPGAKIKRPRHAQYENAVRLKADTDFWIWQNSADIGGFEVPYPPYGFNSYMDQEDVSRSEAIALKLLDPNQSPPSPESQELNQELKASLDNLDPDLRALLFREMGQTDTGAETISPTPLPKAKPEKPTKREQLVKTLDSLDAKAKKTKDDSQAAANWVEGVRKAQKRAGLEPIPKLKKRLDRFVARYDKATQAINAHSGTYPSGPKADKAARDKWLAEFNKLIAKRHAIIQPFTETLQIPEEIRGPVKTSVTYGGVPIDQAPGKIAEPKPGEIANAKEATKQAEVWISKMVSPALLRNMPEIKAEFKNKADPYWKKAPWNGRPRAHAPMWDKSTVLVPDGDAAMLKHEGIPTAIHEWMHNLETWGARFGNASATMTRSAEWYEKRTTKPDGTKWPNQPLGTPYGANEVWREDKWEEGGWDPYAGKFYDTYARAVDGEPITFRYSEVLTMGAERLYRDAMEFYRKDQEGFFHVLQLLQERAEK